MSIAVNIDYEVKMTHAILNAAHRIHDRTKTTQRNGREAKRTRTRKEGQVGGARGE